MVVVNEHDNHDRQRLDSSLVYTGAHNVYYVKSCLSDAKCFSGSRYSFRVQEIKPLLFHNWPVHYPANQKQVLLPVTNNDPASVYLIQSWIENSGDQKDTQFVITPPLFSMQGKKENTLRIINATNHQLPGDRESLFWVNVKAIPAMEKDQKNENTLQLAIISRIKMFYRPTNLAMAPEEAPAMLRFRRSGSKLTLINPTPYFITVTNMKAGNSNLPNTMVPPKGEVSVDIPHAATGDISFQTINDYGALTPRIKATMQ